VLFTQALVIIAEDIKRTEAFARMSQAQPPKARYTVFYIPKVWWKNIFQNFSRRKSGGHGSWILALSSLAAGISLLIVSTFSSSVLIAKDVLYSESVQIQRYIPSANGTISLAPRRDTYFQAISSYLYNASTSIWVSDSHVILPFAPVEKASGIATLHNGTWEAETTILQMENKCMPMSLTGKTVLNASYSFIGGRYVCAENDSCLGRSKGFELNSADGCSVQIHSSPIDENIGRLVTTSSSPQGFGRDSMTNYGGIFWSNMSSSYVSVKDLIRDRGKYPLISPREESTISRVFIYYLSNECRGRDLLLVTPPWWTDQYTSLLRETETESRYWANFTVQAAICTPQIYKASMPARLTVSGDSSNVSFDESEFLRRRIPASKTLFDLARLDDLAFREAWSKYTRPPSSKKNAHGFEGVKMLLARHFEMDLYSMLRNTSVSVEASRLRSRFFGELVLSSVLAADAPTLERISGHHIQTDKRIVVVTEVAITLVVLFILTICYLSFVYWQISAGRRILHLSADPATIVGATSTLERHSTLAKELQSLSVDGSNQAKRVLGTRVYTMKATTIAEITSEHVKPALATSQKLDKVTIPWKRPKTSTSTSIRDWRPSMLQKRWLIALLAFLIALATVLLVLRQYSIEKKLYRTAFVHQINLSVFSNTSTFSPHSIIAALVAVTVGLLWDSIDRPLRNLQPYLSMTRGASTASRGAMLSYQTSYWFWAAARAALHRHWILCLITFGTTLTQICKCFFWSPLTSKLSP
jgi:hypothetical protein